MKNRNFFVADQGAVKLAKSLRFLGILRNRGQLADSGTIEEHYSQFRWVAGPFYTNRADRRAHAASERRRMSALQRRFAKEQRLSD